MSAFQDTAAQVNEKIAWRTRMLDNKELLWLMARLTITVRGLPTRPRCSGSKHIKLSKGLPGSWYTVRSQYTRFARPITHCCMYEKLAQQIWLLPAAMVDCRQDQDTSERD